MKDMDEAYYALGTKIIGDQKHKKIESITQTLLGKHLKEVQNEHL